MTFPSQRSAKTSPLLPSVSAVEETSQPSLILLLLPGLFRVFAAANAKARFTFSPQARPSGTSSRCVSSLPPPARLPSSGLPLHRSSPPAARCTTCSTLSTLLRPGSNHCYIPSMALVLASDVTFFVCLPDASRYLDVCLWAPRLPSVARSFSSVWTTRHRVSNGS